METGSPYDHIKKAVESAGYFTLLRPRKHGGEQLVVASRRYAAETGALSGNSFWISEFEGTWYIGHWSARMYIIPDASRTADFCLDWFARVPDRLPGDFDEHVKNKYALIDMTEKYIPEAVWACAPHEADHDEEAAWP